MRALLVSVWLWQITMLLMLCDCQDTSIITKPIHSTGDETNMSKPDENTNHNNIEKHETMSRDKTTGKIYLGKGVYLYKLNGTNSTTEWKVKDTDVPKLFRLSFPAADPQNANINSVNGNTKSSASSTIDGIHPWILGLAAFVGCLLIVVVMTVIVLARRWMVKTWQMRNYRNNNIDSDSDNLVVEADPEAPKFTGSNSLPHPHRNNNLSLIAPGLLNEQTNYVHSHTVLNQYYNCRQTSPQILSSDNLLPMPDIRPAPEIITIDNLEGEENLQDNGTDLGFVQTFFNNNRQRFEFACDQDYKMSNHGDSYLHCRSNEKLYITDEQPLEFQQQQHLRSISYNRKQNSECDENHEYGYSHETDSYDLTNIAQQQTVGLQVKHSSHKCDISVIFCDAAASSSSQLHNNSKEKQIFPSDASARITAFIPVENESVATFNRASIKMDGYIPSLPCIAGTSCYDDDNSYEWSDKTLDYDESLAVCDTELSPTKGDTLHR